MGRAPVRSAREESQRAPKATENELLSVTLQSQVDDLKAQLRQEGERRKSDRSKVEQHEKTITELQQSLANNAEQTKTLTDEAGRRVKKIKPISSKTCWSKWTRRLARTLQRFDHGDRVRLTLGMLRLASEDGADLRRDLSKHTQFKQFVREIHEGRDKQIGEHLREVVYPAEVWAVLRLVCNLSKREANMIDLATKYRRLIDGSMVRHKLAPDSKHPAPQIFSLTDINSEEEKAIEATGVAFQAHGDRRGADVAAAPFSVDRALFNSIKATEQSRTGGMATSGAEGDEHIILLTGDGAGLSHAESGVRLAGVPGSTNMLNQSSLDIVNLLFYKEQLKAEDYMTWKARLANTLPQLARIWREHELKPGGRRMDPPCRVKLVLTGDKPFIRHVLGLLSHNADSFGGPYCRCKDNGLFNFTHDPRTHYGGFTFAGLCHRAHVPVWQALGEPEPSEWAFTCDCCNQVIYTSYNS